MGNVALAFDSRGRMLRVDQILPLRRVMPERRQSPHYQRIVASIREIGLIEPIVVFPNNGGGKDQPEFILLDGHTRLDILREMGHREVFCLVATDDEAFTYNHKVNYVTPIQEHLMIMKALEHGVSEERIASTLNVDVPTIRKKRDLLEGICPEAVELLKERVVRAATLREMKKVQPMRQIEIAELMANSNNFSVAYARCLLAATPADQLVNTGKPVNNGRMKPEDLSRVQREVETVGREFRLLEDSHGKNTLNLVLVLAYVRKLLDNAAAVRHLSQRYPEVLTEFQKLVDAGDLKS